MMTATPYQPSPRALRLRREAGISGGRYTLWSVGTLHPVNLVSLDEVNDSNAYSYSTP